jgi:hypothetical protein
MKLIASIQGVAAVRVSIEEVMPPSNPPIFNVVSGVRSFFDFAVAPSRESLSSGLPIMFQGGKILDGEKEIGIHQLIMLPDGDLVASSTTDFAERGLDALVAYLNKGFGYRMEGKSAKRYYVSTVVVEFEKPFSEIIPTIGAVQGLLSHADGKDDPFQILRLSFSRGTGGMPNPQSANPLDGLEKADFLIERRAGAPFSANRFFCSAPMRTSDHIRVLEEIEHAAKPTNPATERRAPRVKPGR